MVLSYWVSTSDGIQRKHLSFLCSLAVFTCWRSCSEKMVAWGLSTVTPTCALKSNQIVRQKRTCTAQSCRCPFNFKRWHKGRAEKQCWQAKYTAPTINSPPFAGKPSLCKPDETPISTDNTETLLPSLATLRGTKLDYLSSPQRHTNITNIAVTHGSKWQSSKRCRSAFLAWLRWRNQISTWKDWHVYSLQGG